MSITFAHLVCDPPAGPIRMIVCVVSLSTSHLLSRKYKVGKRVEANNTSLPNASDNFGARMLDHLTTEARNPASQDLDSLSPMDLVRLINEEDATIAAAVRKEEKPIAEAVEVIADRLQKGGRLVYLGAGTSGRLGILDASECPPTFNSNPEQVVGIIAGGQTAMFRAVEGAEDSPTLAAEDLKGINLSDKDVLVGITTSGRTPYVMGGLEYANNVGAFTIGLSCNDGSEINSRSKIAIAPIVGPEIVSGSTRLKAGTATKMVLNTLSTGAMVLIGKTFGNLMVDLQPTNVKLTARARRIVHQATGLPTDQAEQLLQQCDGEVKTAIVVGGSGIRIDEGRSLLHAAGGHVGKALKRLSGSPNGHARSNGQSN